MKEERREEEETADGWEGRKERHRTVEREKAGEEKVEALSGNTVQINMCVRLLLNVDGCKWKPAKSSDESVQRRAATEEGEGSPLSLTDTHNHRKWEGKQGGDEAESWRALTYFH